MEYANENRIAQGEAVRSLVRFKQSPEYDNLLQRELLKARLTVLTTGGRSIDAIRARLKVMAIEGELENPNRCAHEGLIALPRG